MKKIKIIEQSDLTKLEESINEFISDDGFVISVTNIEVKPYDTLGYGLRYLGIITYKIFKSL
ncbi:hypothetical protein [Macrococcus armenti]|uniref:hypothetical protein n=1 Tax=Macrococcus armenti TaxID=2875764 RepID=UPI001CC9C99B|nr:hypothetical protein [Macrococcus armenti]UBH16379.1 hypothetical protein LAU44_05335 [Macrococcus armenti]UBH18735.1 hypothetical protein LAU39_05345 [Macrococcus armenti]UBH21007.1 hypothetical protein LAU40_05340 [Macrococcus armenti]